MYTVSRVIFDKLMTSHLMKTLVEKLKEVAASDASLYGKMAVQFRLNLPRRYPECMHECNCNNARRQETSDLEGR